MRTGPSWMAIMVVSRLPVSFGFSKGFCRLRSRSVSTHLYSDTKHNNAGASSRQSKYDDLMAASRLSLAPMMEYTDKHFRHLVRLISNRTLLYTEMVAVNAISHERRAQIQSYQLTYPEATKDEIQKGYDDFYLRRSLSQSHMPPLEGPSVLQVGGSDSRHMYDAAQTVLEMRDRGVCDYTAINLNCGCPSPKVAGKGCFGAALMANGNLVAELCQALHDGSEGTLPITVKCRIGTDLDSPFTVAGYKALDEENEYSKLCRFIESVASSGIVTDFVIHARIAVLTKNFSPADNRKVPPLKYNLIRRLVQDYPEFTFTLNGGIETIAQAQDEFQACPGLNGVMIGRSWAADPWSFAMTDQLLYKEPMNPAKNRLHVLQEYCKYADAEESEADPQKIRRFLIKAITPLFAGETNAKRYRVALDDIAGLPKKLYLQGKTIDKYPPLSELIMNAAMENLSEEALHRTPEECYAMASLRQSGQIGRSQSVVEWQELRAKQGTSQYDEMLSGGIGN